MTSNPSLDYDLLVIGGGSGGIAAAQRAAAYGARVALVEKNALGGTCVNRGCIPKKLLVHVSDSARQIQAAQSYGWSVTLGQLDWPALLKALHQHVQHLNQVYQKALQDAGVHLIRGVARFADSHTVQTEEQTLTAEKILIAVGAKPIRLDIPGIEQAITSREMFHLPQIPQRMGILGAGYIGVEFGCMMQAFGSQVTLIDRDPMILAGFDPDIQRAVQDSLLRRGIQFRAETTVKNIQKAADGLQLDLSSGDRLEADLLLCATGRAPNLEHLGLDRADVAVQDGAIAVDSYSRTSQPHIFAVGDCTDRMPLTPVAIAEGHAFADSEFGNQFRDVDYRWIPSAVFARPEAASVGLTEDQAREQYGQENIRCHYKRFTPLAQVLTQQPDKTLIKLIVEQTNDYVIGAHMVGEPAAEVIQTLAIALQRGMTFRELQHGIGIHPTVGEELFNTD